jgi:E-phenylitaconyl-CoA hydratase
VAGTVLYDRDGHVVTITYNRPDVRNAINVEMRHDLNAVWEQFRDDEDAWVGILTGAGESFCAGADMKDPAGSAGTWPGSFWEIPTINSYESGLEVWKPTIAAVNGHCLGYGLTLVTRCDFVIAADDARFGFPEVRLGVPTIVGALRLPERVGWSNAMELLLTGDRVDAARAHEMGLAWKVVPRDELMTEARSLAGACSRPHRSRRGRRRRSRRAAGTCPGSRRCGSGRPCAASPPPPRTRPRVAPRRAKAARRSGRAADGYCAGLTR